MAIWAWGRFNRYGAWVFSIRRRGAVHSACWAWGRFSFFFIRSPEWAWGRFSFCFIRSPAWGSFVGVFGVGRFSFSDIFVVIGNDRTQIRMFRLFILSYFGFTHKPFCRY